MFAAFLTTILFSISVVCGHRSAKLIGGTVGAVCLLVVKRRMLRLQAHAPHEMVVEVSKKKWRGVWLWVLVNSLAGQTLGVSAMLSTL